jgi:hypothetical protein
MKFGTGLPSFEMNRDFFGGKIHPGKVCDLILRLKGVAGGHQTMDARQRIQVRKLTPPTDR